MKKLPCLMNTLKAQMLKQRICLVNTADSVSMSAMVWNGRMLIWRRVQSALSNRWELRMDLSRCFPSKHAMRVAFCIWTRLCSSISNRWKPWKKRLRCACLRRGNRIRPSSLIRMANPSPAWNWSIRCLMERSRQSTAWHQVHQPLGSHLWQ